MNEPTLEQLENTACALGLEIILHTRRSPHYREALLNLHGLVTRTLTGDEEAERALEALKRAFGKN